MPMATPSPAPAAKPMLDMDDRPRGDFTIELLRDKSGLLLRDKIDGSVDLMLFVNQLEVQFRDGPYKWNGTALVPLFGNTPTPGLTREQTFDLLIWLDGQQAQMLSAAEAFHLKAVELRRLLP